MIVNYIHILMAINFNFIFINYSQVFKQEFKIFFKNKINNNNKVNNNNNNKIHNNNKVNIHINN